MQNLRDIKRKARRDLHARMLVPAVYIAAPGDLGVPITVRLHTKFAAIGMKDSEAGLASRREATPKIVFMRDELAAAGINPKRKAIISVEPGEAYALDNADAPDDITVTFFVTVVPAGETVGLPVPDLSDG